MANKKQPAPLSLPKELPLLPAKPGRMCNAKEIRFCELIGSGMPVGEAEKVVGWAQSYSGRVMKRPHVMRLMTEAKELAIEKAKAQIAERITLNLSQMDFRLAEVVESGPDFERGYTDRLKALDIGYKRLGGYPTAPAAMATVNILQQQYPPTTYQPRWAREKLGRNDANDDAIEQQLGLGRTSSAPVRVESGSPAASSEALGAEDALTNRSVK